MPSNIAECSSCLNNSEQIICTDCRKHLMRFPQYKRLGDSEDVIFGVIDKHCINAKKSGRKVLVGISGGVDSTFIASVCGELGHDIELFHFDNGWNTQLASKNIYNLIQTYDFKLKTYIQDWNVFSSLQRSFLRAGVPDIELITDHAIFALMSNSLSNDKFITLSGANFCTEHGLNTDYVWNKLDIKNIRAVNYAYENIDLTQFPKTNMWNWLYRRVIARSAIYNPLNEFWYKRKYAVDFLAEKISFTDYKFKHEESLLTKIYQRIILRDKFKYLKVKTHINALIRNEELSKSDGRLLLQDFQTASIDEYELSYFLDKLGFSKNDWEEIINSPPVSHLYFDNDNRLYQMLQKLNKLSNRKSM